MYPEKTAEIHDWVLDIMMQVAEPSWIVILRLVRQVPAALALSAALAVRAVPVACAIILPV